MKNRLIILLSIELSFRNAKTFETIQYINPWLKEIILRGALKFV